MAAFIAAWAVTSSADAAAAGESSGFTLINSVLHDYTVLEYAGKTITGDRLQGTATVIESGSRPFSDGTQH